MKENIFKAFNWLVKSSADPDSLALSVKAGLPFVVLAGGLAGLKLEETDLLLAVHTFAVVVTGLTTLWGLGRKIYLTSKQA